MIYIQVKLNHNKYMDNDMKVLEIKKYQVHCDKTGINISYLTCSYCILYRKYNLLRHYAITQFHAHNQK